MASCSALLMVVLLAGLTSARPHWRGHENSGWKPWWRHDHQHGGDRHVHEGAPHVQWPHWKYGQHEHQGHWPHWKHGQRPHGHWPHGQWPHGQHSATWHNTHPDVKNPFVVMIPTVVYPSVVTTTQLYDKHSGVDTTIEETGTNQEGNKNPDVNANPNPGVDTNQEIDKNPFYNTNQEIDNNPFDNTNQEIDKNPFNNTNQEIDQNPFDNTNQEIDKNSDVNTNYEIGNNPNVDTDQNLDKWMEYLDDKNDTLNIPNSNTPQNINLNPFDNTNKEVNKNPDVDANQITDLEKWMEYLDDIEKNDTLNIPNSNTPQKINPNPVDNTNEEVNKKPDVDANQITDLEKWMEYLDDIEINETTTTSDFDATHETNTEQGGLENTNQNVVPNEEQNAAGTSNHPDNETNAAIIHGFNTDQIKDVGQDNQGTQPINPNNVYGKFTLVNGFWVWIPGFPANNSTDTVKKDDKEINKTDEKTILTEDEWNKYIEESNSKNTAGTSPVEGNSGTKNICDEIFSHPERMYMPDQIKECIENSVIMSYDPVEGLAENNESKDKDVGGKDGTKLKTFEEWAQHAFNANEEKADIKNIYTDEKKNQGIDPNQDFNTNQEIDSDVGSLKTADDWMDHISNNGGTKPDEEPSTEQNFNANQEIDPYEEVAEIHDFNTNQEIAVVQDFNSNQEIDADQEYTNVQVYSRVKQIDSDVNEFVFN